MSNLRYLPWLAPLTLAIAGLHSAANSEGLFAATTSVIAPATVPLVMARQAEQPIRLASMAVTAQVSGGLATTQVTLSLHNPNRRDLEGELQFPLLEGQTVTGFALESPDGLMLPAVAVGKARGQEVFEAIERLGVDPALLEQTQGNNYKLRVYPLPAGKARRVMLEISELLTPDAAGRYLYRPPAILAQADRLSLTLRVHGQGGDRLVLPDELRGAEVLNRHGDAWVVFEQTGGVPLPAATAIAWPASTQPVVFSDRFEDMRYFHADIPLPEPAQPRPAPRSMALVWDASGTGATRDHERAFALLQAYFQALGDVQVTLVVARDVAEAPLSFTVKGGDWAALRAALRALAYDGASDPAAWMPPPGHDLALLFSDGLGNWGTGVEVTPSTPLYAISAAARANPAHLRRLAEDAPGGGQYLDLLELDTAAALAELQAMRPRLELEDGAGVADVVAASVYARHGMARVAGRITSAQATLHYRLRWPDGRVAAHTLPIPVEPDATALISQVAAKRWAGYRVARLEAEPTRHRAEIERLGKRFGLVTSQTSLLALESLADHVRYDVLPPPGPWRVAFLQQQASREKSTQTDRRTHLDGLVARFGQLVQWWRKDYPKETLPSPAKPQPEWVQREPAQPVVGHSVAAQPDAPPRYQAAAETGRAPEVAASVGGAPGVVATAMMRRVETLGVVLPEPSRASSDVRMGRAESPVTQSFMVASPSRPSGASAIRLQAWQPDAPYARRLREASNDQRYILYLDERPGHLNSTTFFLDAADIFFEKGQPALALRVLSNLAEMNLESRQILRVLAYRLLRAGQVKLALPLLQRVRDLAPEEPQSWRDLGLALEADGQFQAALDALWAVASRPWDRRFPDIDLTALHELNALVARHPGLDTHAIDPRLLQPLPVALRAVLAWDADNTDIDLWVVDPNGEQTNYHRPASYQGGRLSADFTGGYGPETFLLKDAKPGRYEIRAHFYGHRQQVLLPYTTLMLRLTTGYGTPEQKDENIVLRLSGQDEQVLVGSIEVAR